VQNQSIIGSLRDHIDAWRLQHASTEILPMSFSSTLKAFIVTSIGFSFAFGMLCKMAAHEWLGEKRLKQTPS
jgi:hypothetical protein